MDFFIESSKSSITASKVKKVPDDKWLMEQERRKEHLLAQCSSGELKVKTKFHENILLDNIIVDVKHKLLYCYVPKVCIDSCFNHDF